VKHLYRVVDERDGFDDLPLLSVSIHRGVQLRNEVTEDEPRADDLAHYKIVQPNDIVINRMRAFQGALGCSPTSGIVSPDYLVLRARNSINPIWLALVFRSRGFIGEMTARLRGIGSTESGMIRTPRINAADLGDIRIVVPANDHQVELVDRIQSDLAKHEALREMSKKMVAVLRERRAALISAAVTGKIDVRGR
jgi:type I restriction enzyme S subunit